MFNPIRVSICLDTQYLIFPTITFQNSFDRESDNAKDNSELFVPNNEERNLGLLSSNVSVSSYLNNIEGMKSNEHEVNECKEIKIYFQLGEKTLINICHLNDDMILFFLQATFIESSQLADIVPSEIVSNTNTFNNEFGVDLGDNEVLILTLSGTPKTTTN